MSLSTSVCVSVRSSGSFFWCICLSAPLIKYVNVYGVYHEFQTQKTSQCYIWLLRGVILSKMSEISIMSSIVIACEGKQVKSDDGGKGCSMLNKHSFQQPQVNKGMFTDVASLLVRTNMFLAVMSSSSSDNVTQSVRPSVRPFVRPWPFFDS